jgi:hypothetical protein
MDADQYQGAVRSALADAVDYIDANIAPVRAKATRYYNGDPFGNEEEGRSQIVMTVVRDKVLSMLPAILRMFTSSEEMVQYTANSEDKVDQADQATDYANHIIWKDNPGFLVVSSWLKDGLIRKLGIVKARWSEQEEVTESSYSGLMEDDVARLAAEDGVEILAKEEMQELPGFWELRIRRTVETGRVVVECLPPEEFLVNRDARDLASATVVAHRSRPTVSDLVAMGYDQEEIESNAGYGAALANQEQAARNPAAFSSFGEASASDVIRRVDYTESYIRIDKDGDSIAELRRVCSLGEGHYILHDEVADFLPFATFCPDPEPHMVFGQSIADQVGDLQLIQSNIVRNTLDSLAQSIHPRTAVVEGQVNLDDVMNNEVGGIIRMRQVGMVTPMATPFVGQAAMPILAYMDEIAASRTGISAASAGLDPDVLQSTTAKAVTATVQGAQERIEMVARFFAETGMKQLFRIILKLICKHQDQPRIVRMRGKFVPIDPRAWDADLDVQVNVALGRGTDQDKIQALTLVLQKQEQIIQLLGPDNPICGVEEYSNTLSQITALMGFKDASRYFKRSTVEQLQQFMAAKPQQPDPNTALVQIEAQKVSSTAQNNQQKLALDAHEVELTDQRERMKIHGDLMVRMSEIEAKYKTAIDTTHIEALIEHDKALATAKMEAMTAAHAAEAQAAADKHSAEQSARSEQLAAMLEARSNDHAAALSAHIDTVKAHSQHIGKGMEQMAKAIAAPQVIVRDASGRVAGSQRKLD